MDPALMMTVQEVALRRRLRWHAERAKAAKDGRDYSEMIHQYQECDTQLDHLLALHPEWKIA